MFCRLIIINIKLIFKLWSNINLKINNNYYLNIFLY